MLNMIRKIDTIVFNHIKEKIEHDKYNNFMKFITFLGDYAVVGFIIIVFLFVKGKRIESYSMLFSLVITSLLNEVFLKKIFKRTRPAIKYSVKETLIKVPKSYSFPSGHTATSFSIVPLAFRLSIALGILTFVMAVLVGFSRIYVKVHYFSDVIAGSMLGTGISMACLSAFF